MSICLPVATSYKNKSPISDPRSERETPMYFASGEGSYQSMVRTPVASRAFGSRPVPAVLRSKRIRKDDQLRLLQFRVAAKSGETPCAQAPAE